EVAVNSTRINRDINDMQNSITVQQNDLLKDIDQKADIIVSNILADILLMLIDDAWNNLKDGGYFITSGIIESKQAIVREAMEQKGFSVIAKNELDHWVSFIVRK